MNTEDTNKRIFIFLFSWTLFHQLALVNMLTLYELYVSVDELSRRTLLFFIFSLCSILGLTWICWIISTICNRRGRYGQQNFKQCKKEVQAEDLHMKAESEHMARIYDDTKCKSPVENQTCFNVPEDNTYVEMKHIYQNWITLRSLTAKRNLTIQ